LPDENTNAAKPAAATEDGAEAVSEEELDEPSEADDDFAAKKKSAPPRGAKRNAPSRRAKSVPSDLGIADDNALFEAVRSDSSLQLSVDDWVQSYLDAPEDKGQPMADLINFVFRVSSLSMPEAWANVREVLRLQRVCRQGRGPRPGCRHRPS
jgi:hypothetical protein